MAKSAILAIDIVSDASKAAAGFDSAGSSATGLASDLGKVDAAATEADRKMRLTAEGADNLDSKSAQATGSLGALSSGFELVGLDKYAMGLQSAAMATDFFAGVGEGLNLILELQWVQTLRNTVAKIKDAIVTKATAAATVVWTGAQAALNAVMAANPIALVILAIVALTAAVIIAYKKSDTFRKVVDAAFSAIQRVIIGTVNAVVGFVKSHWKLLLAILTGPFGLAFLAIQKFGPRIVDVVQSAYGRVISFLAGARDRIVSAVFAAFDRARTVAANALSRTVDSARNMVDRVVGFIKDLPGRIVRGIGDLGHLLYDAGVDVLQGFLDGLKDKWEDVKDTLTGWTDDIPNIKGPIDKDRRLLYGAGNAIMDGLLAGIEDRRSALTSKLGDVTRQIAGGVNASQVSPGVGSTIAGVPLAAGSNVFIIQGAVDPYGTAQQIKAILTRGESVTGRLVGVTG